MRPLRVKVLSILVILALVFGLVGFAAPAYAAPTTVGANVVSAATGEASSGTSSAAKSAAKSAAASNTTSIITAANAYFAELPADINKIGEKAFMDKVAAGEKMFILDIRSAADYAKGHIKGALNAPWGTAISDNLKNLPADRPIMVYCYTGQTAGQTVALLKMAGFDAKSVNLGWNLGISKVADYAKFVETKVNKFAAVKTVAVSVAVKTAIEAYFKGLDTVKGTPFANYKISEDDAKKLLDAKDPSVLFLSVRNAADYGKGHIEGAINIPFGKGMEKSFAQLPKDKKIIVYCYTGQTAGQTVAGLRLLGYDAVSMHSGMGTAATVPAGWVNKGFPVISTVAEKANSYFANLPADINKIGEKDFVAKVAAGEKMLVLDIRSAADYTKGHIKGAVNAPWGMAIAENLENLPTDKQVMVYCYTGQTAGQTVALLKMAGFDAKSVNLGWNLGISKVEGYDKWVETTENPIASAVKTVVNAEMKAAIEAYFKGMEVFKGGSFANYKISEDDAKKLLDMKLQSVMFLSVRSAADFAKGHIEGAINIPFGKGMEMSFTQLPKDKKIIVYCYTGQTAGQTVAGLRLLGYDAVSMHSGMGTAATVPAGWLNKGFPVVQ